MQASGKVLSLRNVAYDWATSGGVLTAHKFALWRPVIDATYLVEEVLTSSSEAVFYLAAAPGAFDGATHSSESVLPGEAHLPVSCRVADRKRYGEHRLHCSGIVGKVRLVIRSMSQQNR